MNVIWCFILISGAISLIITSPDLFLLSLTNASEKAITLSLKLWGIYTLWLGILKIVEESELSKKIEQLFSPIINKLFPSSSPEAKQFICINITSNMLGLGNASIPSGINAISALDEGKDYLTTSMLLFIILNVCNLQIFPTTIISLRALHGSSNPSDIILPNLISSLFSITLSLTMVWIFTKWRKRKC